VELSVSSSSLVKTSVPPRFAAFGGSRRTICGVRSLDIHPGTASGLRTSARNAVPIPIALIRAGREFIVLDKNAVSQTNAATAAEDPAMTPEAIVEQLRVLQGHIPNYVQLSVPDAATLRTASNLHPDFSQAAIDAVGASPRLEATVGQSAETMQSTLEAAARLAKVEEELKAMLDGVSSSILTLRHSVGHAALMAYEVSKRLVKEPEHANLLPHVASMRKTNRFGRNRKAKAQTPAPAPAPVPVPTTPHV